MHWTITYYSDAVQEEILAMPAGFLGRYLRYTDRMELYGTDLGMPHTRAMGEGRREDGQDPGQGACHGASAAEGDQGCLRTKDLRNGHSNAPM
jgi:hypothetical protein